MAPARNKRSTIMISAVATGLLLALTLSSIFCAGSCFAQTVSPVDPPLKSVQVQTERPAAPDTVVTGGTSKQEKLKRCVESWDLATHMTKKEWRNACDRSVKDYPDSFK
jgi:hypothetical protein